MRPASPHGTGLTRGLAYYPLGSSYGPRTLSGFEMVWPRKGQSDNS